MAGFLGTESLSRSPQRAKNLLGAAAPPEKRSARVNFEASASKEGRSARESVLDSSEATVN